MKIKGGADNQGLVPVTMLNIGRGVSYGYRTRTS
jgi:hypothetical protein